MCLGAIAGIGSAVIGGISSKSAAKAQQGAAQDQLELGQQQFEYQKEQFAPYSDAGTNALAAYNYELGLGPAPTIGGTAPQITTEEYTVPGQVSPANRHLSRDTWRDRMMQDSGQVPSYRSAPETRTRYNVGDNSFNSLDEAQAWATANPEGGEAYGGFTKTPGYDFRLNEGYDAVNASVGSRHGLNSGAALKSLTEYGQNYASGEYGNHMNRLAGLMGVGQASAAGQAAASQNYTNVGANAYANYGDARASGAIGVNNAIQGGLNNGLGIWAYNQGRNGS